MPYLQADTERVLGAEGTVEQAYKPKAGKRYSTASKPSARLAGTSITGTVPTQAQRAKRESIERQQAKPTRKPKGGKPKFVEYVGRTRDDLYGIKVKVTGIKADIYWLPWSKASELWYEMSGTNLSDYLGE